MYVYTISVNLDSVLVYLSFFLFTLDLFGFDSLGLKTGGGYMADDFDDTNLTPYNNCDNNWSDLHEDLLDLILKEIITIFKEEKEELRRSNVADCVADCVRFGSVCVSWRSVLIPHIHPDLLHPQLPFLMIPSLPWPKSLPPSPSPSPNKEEEKETRSFYSLSERRVISEDLKIKLPYNMYCRGCSYGWIIATGNEDTGFSVELLNPFISINNEYQKIQLPPLTAFPYDPELDVFHIDYMEKAVLSANPTTTTDYVVMAIYLNGKLSFWKPGNEVWIDIPIEGRVCLDDVIYHHTDELFYLVNLRGEVMVCDLNHGAITVRRFGPLPKIGFSACPKRYLVESSGDLLMLHKYLDAYDIRRFGVYKFCGDKKKSEEEVVIRGPSEWKFIKTLPEQMLFVGDNNSMSLSTSDFIGGKSGCIYFTDDAIYHKDVGFPLSGIFNMKDETIEKLQPAGSNDYISPANTIFVVAPTLWCCLRF